MEMLVLYSYLNFDSINLVIFIIVVDETTVETKKMMKQN